MAGNIVFTNSEATGMFPGLGDISSIPPEIRELYGSVKNSIGCTAVPQMSARIARSSVLIRITCFQRGHSLIGQCESGDISHVMILLKAYRTNG
ncbi:MAG: hypothetical protein MZW92_71370 [Comamonadaceae bacterium]|nr:hypothetical protein [Comamonadaceae bacterium]